MEYPSDTPVGTDRFTSAFQLSAAAFGIATSSQNVKLVSSYASNHRFDVFFSTAKQSAVNAERREKLHPPTGSRFAKRPM